ncbi:maltase 2-like [Acanthaster planci]|uniref:Maltase 2-like n=1 Tax=Acanthaster planci TaxID=133434 RepID=A0A8B7YS67_ACAPL|nr:maltase 2-like [Acanthaster planci]
MEGTTNPSYYSEGDQCGTPSSTASPKPRQRIPRILSSPTGDAGDGTIYRSSWVGMDENAVQVRSNHIFWRVFRLTSLGVITVSWLAVLLAAVAMIAWGDAGQGSRCMAKEHWFDVAVGYQIVPASFQDSDGDGYGDLKGIISRLDYLDYLGVDAIWLGPVFQSAHKDLWLDVTDLTAVDGVFGTMQDFEEFVTAVHNRSMKLILEFIPNHTSDQHPWFQDSRQGQNNDYSEYYIWADGTNGRPPQYTMGSDWETPWSWEYDPTRRQWYLSSTTEEPDLNYRNPAVVSAIKDALKFWLEKGVDGFFMRHADRLIEPWMLADTPGNTVQLGDGATRNDNGTSQAREEILNVIIGWRQLLDEYESSNSKLLVVDTGTDPALAAMVSFNISQELGKANLPFNFMFLDMTSPLNGHQLRTVIESWIDSGPMHSSRHWAVGSADVSRAASRYGERISRVMLFLMLMLPGSPLLYYGDEIGMTDGQKVNDSIANDNAAEAMRSDRELTRSPMQWSPDIYAGFTNASLSEPWVPVGVNATKTNVELQKLHKNSTLAFIERTIQYRRDNTDLFGIGYQESFRLQATFKEVLAFTRESPSGGQATAKAVFAAVNVAEYEVSENFESREEQIPGAGNVVVATNMSRVGESISFSKLLLRSEEAILIQYEPLPKPDGFSKP